MSRFGNDEYSSEDVLDEISNFPNIDFTLWDQNNIKKQWNYPENEWIGNLNTLKSTLGYKLNISPFDSSLPVISLHGVSLHPDTMVTVQGGVKEWLGYFIEESQYPWQAFPPDIYDTKLSLIQAQYWMMVKTPAGWLTSGKVTPIRYGDMVIVKSAVPYTLKFKWNHPIDSEEDVEIPLPMAYTWEEQADYTAFFIETDTASDISEIAVKVDGVCKGASVRQQGDTLVEVDGYFQDLPAGAVVEFETWNGQKSTPVVKNAYIVNNPVSGRKEKRNIYIGEQQDYYQVSFKAGEVFETPDDISNVSCQPNPFTNEVILTLRLNLGQPVWVEIYDITGTKVRTLIEGNLPGGYYEVRWKGDNEKGNKVNEGVYFYKIRTGNGTEITEKIILIN
jgi:hypothetical protein